MAAVPVLADTVYPGANSNFTLQYGSGSTSCNSSRTNYFISGNAYNSNCYLGVEIYNPAGRAAYGYNEIGTYAGAIYRPGLSLNCTFKANSALKSR